MNYETKASFATMKPCNHVTLLPLVSRRLVHFNRLSINLDPSLPFCRETIAMFYCIYRQMSFRLTMQRTRYLISFFYQLQLQKSIWYIPTKVFTET